MKKNAVLTSIMHAIQGAVVGVGAILPGVSGGVLCVAFGIYEPMMAMLTHPVKSFKKYYKLFIPFIIGKFNLFEVVNTHIPQVGLQPYS